MFKEQEDIIERCKEGLVSYYQDKALLLEHKFEFHEYLENVYKDYLRGCDNNLFEEALEKDKANIRTITSFFFNNYGALHIMSEKTLFFILESLENKNFTSTSTQTWFYKKMGQAGEYHHDRMITLMKKLKSLDIAPYGDFLENILLKRIELFNCLPSKLMKSLKDYKSPDEKFLEQC